MKNLLFALSFGLVLSFSTSAFAQEVKGDDKPKKENTRSNGKGNKDRKLGKERAGTVQEMNGETKKLGQKEAKKAEKAAKKQEKEARKQEKARLKAEKKLMKSDKIKM